jgi:hypothetical protein
MCRRTNFPYISMMDLRGKTDYYRVCVGEQIFQGIIQRGRSPFVQIALQSSLMLWLKVVPSDGIGILPPICDWPPRGCTI